MPVLVLVDIICISSNGCTRSSGKTGSTMIKITLEKMITAASMTSGISEKAAWAFEESTLLV